MAKWVRLLVVCVGLAGVTWPEPAECSACDPPEPIACKVDTDCPQLCRCWVREQTCVPHF